ncbi:hypothetical protein BDR26DRAFT_929434 [Obelidium mucronatum]|nr:hypothetical protein BDR26DRAFT_929434 [Obelidium mucronatum]
MLFDQQQQQDCCSVCLLALDPRGGVPLINPGCCGNSFHFACYNQLLAQANASSIASCPLCRKQFNAPAVQALQQPNQGFQSANASQLANGFSFSPLRLVAVDDPLPSIGASLATTTSATPPTVSWNPAFPTISPTATDLTALLSIKAASYPTPSAGAVPTLGVDLVVCVDVSGSMDGAPLNSVKQTLRYIVTQMTPNDRIALIEFNSDARQLTRFHVGSPDSPNPNITNSINAMNATGGTSIVSACKLALEVMRMREVKNSASGVLLLSDGQDSRSNDYTEFLLQAEEQKIPFYTYGFGVDHDSKLLSQVAGKTGTFTYIPQISVFQEAFAGCLGGIKSTVYKNFQISIKVPSAAVNVKLAAVECSQDVAYENDTAVVKFGDLFAEEQRDIIVKFSFTPATSNRMEIDGDALEHQRLLGVARYSYEDVFSSQNIVHSSPTFSIPIAAQPPVPVNSLVTRQVLRLLAVKQMKLLASAPNRSVETAQAWVQSLQLQIKRLLIESYLLDSRTGFEINLLDESKVPTNIPAEDWPFIVAIVGDVIQSAKLKERGSEATRSAMLTTYSNQRAIYTSSDLAAEGSTSRFQSISGYQNRDSSSVQKSSRRE